MGISTLMMLQGPPYCGQELQKKFISCYFFISNLGGGGGPQ